MSFETILYKKDGAVAKIVLNRPEKRNAQSMRLINELDEAFKVAEADSDVRVIILAGAGSSFSAGHDLAFWTSTSDKYDDILDVPALRSTPESLNRHEQEMYYEKCLAIRNLTKPVIGQIHGHCLAAGLMLAAMCDIIYASEDASFGNPVLRMGACAAEVLIEPWELGPRRAKEMLFTCEPIPAHEAYRLGFVNKVVPRERLEEDVLELARKIALTPPVAVSLTKASINRTMDLIGQTNSWQQHFVAHQFAHWTNEARAFEEQRKKAGELKEQLKYQKGNFSS